MVSKQGNTGFASRAENYPHLKLCASTTTALATALSLFPSSEGRGGYSHFPAHLIRPPLATVFHRDLHPACLQSIHGTTMYRALHPLSVLPANVPAGVSKQSQTWILNGFTFAPNFSHRRFMDSTIHKSLTTRRTTRIYFSNFFHRLICAATFFGDGAPMAVRPLRARRTSNTLPAAGPYFLAASLGNELWVFSASPQSAPTA